MSGLREDASDHGGEGSRPMKRRDKGKGKARPTVDIPDTVWERIFEFYYDQVCDDWHHSDRLCHGLTPLLISRNLAHIALPVLYRHPHIGYSNMKSFECCLQLPSRFSQMSKAQMVRHLTMRPSPSVPRREPTTHHGDYSIIHPSFPDVLRHFGYLQSFTLKDTLLLSYSDACRLLQGLKEISPNKCRLEFRMWDLHISSIGPALIAGSSSKIYAPLSHSVSIPQHAIETPPNRNIGPAAVRWGDGGTTLMQECWREALYNGGEVEFPSWWLDPARPVDNQAGAAATRQHGALPPAFHPGQNIPQPGSAQAQAALRDIALQMQAASQSVFNRPRPPDMRARRVSAPTGGWLVPPATLTGVTSQVQAEVDVHLVEDGDDRVTAAIAPPSGPIRLAESGVAGTTNSDRARREASIEISLPSLPTTNPARRDLTQSPPSSSKRQRYISMPNTVSRSTQTGYPHLAGNDTLHPLPLPSVVSAQQTLSTDVSAQALGSDMDGLHNHVETADFYEDVDEVGANGVDPSSEQMTEQQHNRTDHIYIPTDADLNTNFWPNAVPTQHQPESDEFRPGTTSPPDPFFQSLVVGRLPTAPEQRNESTIASSSYHLAHDIRRLLRDLIELHWWPRLQALSIVAHDPLASLIVRAPQLDFWTYIPVPHIRVHLPRGTNSLAVFKGAKEAARDRRRRERDLQLSSPSDDGPTDGDKEMHLHVGGDGSGGGLVHPSNRLFEIELNTLAEMMDEVWFTCGDQLPPQVCRILAGEQDWREIRIGPSIYDPDSLGDYEDERRDWTGSPATSGFQSPAFSFASLESGSDEGSGRGDAARVGVIDTVVGGEGNTYDVSAANEQQRRVASKQEE